MNTFQIWGSDTTAMTYCILQYCFHWLPSWRKTSFPWAETSKAALIRLSIQQRSLMMPFHSEGRNDKHEIWKWSQLSWQNSLSTWVGEDSCPQATVDSKSPDAFEFWDWRCLLSAGMVTFWSWNERVSKWELSSRRISFGLQRDTSWWEQGSCDRGQGQTWWDANLPGYSDIWANYHLTLP